MDELDRDVVDLKTLVDEFLNSTPAQRKSWAEEEENRERSYRRGWEQGFTYAGDVYLALIAEGLTDKEIRKLIIRFEESISYWRVHLARERPPYFDRQKLQEQFDNEEADHDA